MSNRRADRQIPDGFRKYDGEYEKCFYDVLTYNGVVFKHCWPNAGMFHTQAGRFLEPNNILAIRPSYEGDISKGLHQ